ncbi:MAG: ABC transporter substrate-binding protein [Thermodesulfobacteriota bacterium]|nr:ABC transporter substrate-binding protein [Thermodesulfobacteriota bacterium]
MERRPMSTGCMLVTVCVFTVFILIWGSADGYSEPVRGVTDTTIKIGAILDQTGPIAGDIGLPVTDALKIYTMYINDSGGLFGRKVKLTIEDDRYSIPAGIAAFKKLLFKDRIFAMVGPASVGETKALFGQIDRLKVPTITGAPDKSVVVPFKKYMFMPFNVYGDQLGVIFDYIIKDLKPEKFDITFVYPDAESGKVALAATREWAKHFDFKFDTEIINLGALEATSQVLSIKRKRPTHIVIHHGSPGTAVLLREMKKFGLNIPVYGTMVTCTEDTVRMAGNASKNYIGAHAFSSWYNDMEGPERMRKITLKYRPGTEKSVRNMIFTAGWIITTTLYEGLTRAGKNLNIESMVTALESIKDLDTKGLCGPITFSSTDHQGLYHSKLYKADPQTGTLVPIGDWRKAPPIE